LNCRRIVRPRKVVFIPGKPTSPPEHLAAYRT
jgi:hypothetical protein